MRILGQKPNTKRPVIVAAATALFASRGVDATSMRDVADAAGVREAAIYRHFRGKEEMAQEIFTSWYEWYGQQVQEIAQRADPLPERLSTLVHLEFAAAREHPQEFLYFCENEARFLRRLRRDVPRVRQELIKMIRKAQARGVVRSGNAGLLADMLSGALCTVAISAIRRKDSLALESEKLAAESCWQMIKPNK
ncbi:MAG TPA: TetR/AcrR family transcriptional regulator [Candidatus Binataceae bacterium]|nr:TetR/AcrR family transcriptional regulator [Candidatus Binataceae bacterium]